MSKANQKFVQADEAVSPVIGVILMVAITVVLAAVVFVLVSNLSKNSNDSAPKIGFSKSGNGNSTVLTVISAETTNTPWSAFNMTTSAPSTCIATLGGGVATTESVSAGHRIIFSTSSGTCSGETFNLVHLATNSIAYTTVIA